MPGDLEVREARPRKCEQLLLGDGLVEDDRGAHLLAPGRVGNPEADRFFYGGMRPRPPIHLSGRGFLAPPIYHLPDSPPDAPGARAVRNPPGPPPPTPAP